MCSTAFFAIFSSLFFYLYFSDMAPFSLLISLSKLGFLDASLSFMFCLICYDGDLISFSTRLSLNFFCLSFPTGSFWFFCCSLRVLCLPLRQFPRYSCLLKFYDTETVWGIRNFKQVLTGHRSLKCCLSVQISACLNNTWNNATGGLPSGPRS